MTIGQSYLLNLAEVSEECRNFIGIWFWKGRLPACPTMTTQENEDRFLTRYSAYGIILAVAIEYGFTISHPEGWRDRPCETPAT